jgi:aryl-alcohol dehydrogenase
VKGIITDDSVADVFIPQLIDLYLEGRFPFEKKRTFYPFEDIEKAVNYMVKGLVLKPVLRF